MVAEEHLRYQGQGETKDTTYQHSIADRTPMMLPDSKFFPGHPSNFPPAPLLGLDCGPGFPRKDFFSQRKQREFIPENKKDDSYWDRRRRNNEAAKRSREKRRVNDMLLETRVIELSKDNHILQAQLNAIFEKYGIKGENMIEMDAVLSTLPTNDQVLNFTKKRLGPLTPMSPDPSTPPPSLNFPSLGLPITINNNNNSNSTNHNNRSRSCSPANMSPAPDRYRTPSPFHNGPPMPPLASYPEVRPYPLEPRPNVYRRAPTPQRYEDEAREAKEDTSLALNLSADNRSTGSDGRGESRSSASSTPPVTSSNIQDGGSSGDESGYPRSPNSAGSSSGSGDHSLPHKLRFKSVVSEKEAVSSLLSLHQMAMINRDREPVDRINHWMEAAAAGAANLPHPGFLASLLPAQGVKQPFQEREEEEDEPVATKRFKRSPVVGGGGGGGMPDNLKDEVARLTSEVATLKDILVNRMKETDEEEKE